MTTTLKVLAIWNLLFYQYLIWFSHNKLVMVISCILTILTSLVYPNMPKLIKHPLVWLSVLVCFGLVGEAIFLNVVYLLDPYPVIDIRRFLIYT
jgi:hypothetical protein